MYSPHSNAHGLILNSTLFVELFTIYYVNTSEPSKFLILVVWVSKKMRFLKGIKNVLEGGVVSGRLQIVHDGQQVTGGASLAGDPKINIFRSRYST